MVYRVKQIRLEQGEKIELPTGERVVAVVNVFRAEANPPVFYLDVLVESD